MFNISDRSRDTFQLFGRQAEKGYDWWWHSFTARNHITDEEKAFFIEFFLVNPAYGEEEPVFGQLPGNQAAGRKPSYLMVKAGTWGEDAAQLHRFYGWKQIQVDTGCPFSINAGECFLDETHTYGSISVSEETAAEHPEMMSDAGRMKWDLSISKKIAFNVGYGASSVFRRLQLFEMFWHAEGMKTEYAGTVTWNDEVYDVIPESCYGYADKNWGKDFTSPWVWISSNHLTSLQTGKKLKNSVFDIGGGCPKIGPVALKRQLLSAMFYEGKCYEFNFSKFWTGTRTLFDCRETDTEIIWHVEQRTWHERMVTDLACQKKDMLLINYESPDGRKRHRHLYNGGNGKGTVRLYHKGKLIDEIRAENAGCEYGEYDPD